MKKGKKKHKSSVKADKSKNPTWGSSAKWGGGKFLKPSMGKKKKMMCKKHKKSMCKMCGK